MKEAEAKREWQAAEKEAAKLEAESKARKDAEDAKTAAQEAQERLKKIAEEEARLKADLEEEARRKEAWLQGQRSPSKKLAAENEADELAKKRKAAEEEKG